MNSSNDDLRSSRFIIQRNAIDHFIRFAVEHFGETLGEDSTLTIWAELQIALNKFDAQLAIQAWNGKCAVCCEQPATVVVQSSVAKNIPVPYCDKCKPL